MKQKIPMLELYSLLSNTYDFLAESNSSFHIMDNSFLCYSWYNGYRQNTLLSSIYNINVFSITFLTINSIINQVPTCNVLLFLWYKSSHMAGFHLQWDIIKCWVKKRGIIADLIWYIVYIKELCQIRGLQAFPPSL